MTTTWRRFGGCTNFSGQPPISRSGATTARPWSSARLWRWVRTPALSLQS